MPCSWLYSPQDRRLQWKPPSHFIVYNVSKVTDYKLNRWSSSRYVKEHHTLRCDSFTWVKRSGVNLVPRLVMGSGLQVFHNVLVTVAVATLPFRLLVSLWNRHEKEFEKIAHDVGFTSRIIYIYRMLQNSVNCLVICTLKYGRNSCITCWIKKNCSKWGPPCSLRKSQRCDTVIQIYWQA
jgi:hypothetical protein